MRVEIDAEDKTADEILSEAGVTPDRAVLVVIGGADNMPSSTFDMLVPFFDQAIAPVVAASAAVVLTGGTDSGVMKLAGLALRGTRSTLIGVSPKSAREESQPPVHWDANHNIQVSTLGASWGAETATLVDLARTIAGDSAPRLVLLANGGQGAAEEVNRFLDDGWPVLSLAGTGGAADDLIRYTSGSKRRAKSDSRIARAFRKLHHRQHKATAASSPVVYDRKSPKPSGAQPALHEHSSSANLKWRTTSGPEIEVFDSIQGSTHDLNKLLLWRFSNDELLKQAWITFSDLDRTADQQQRLSKRFRTILGLATFVFVLLVSARIQAKIAPSAGHISAHIPQWVLHTLVTPVAVALPIGVAVAAALSDTIAADRGWHALRTGAETMKREIYRYRAASTERGQIRARAALQLKAAIDEVTKQCAAAGVLLLSRSSFNAARPSISEGDDELGPLSARSYLMHRINHQLAYYRSSGSTLRKKESTVIGGSALMGAAAGTLATTQLAPWATVLVLAAALLAGYLERNRLHGKAQSYTTAAAELSGVVTWWHSPGRNGQARTLHSLVEKTEKIFEAENRGWSHTA